MGDERSCVISVFAQRTRQLSLAQACPVTWRRRLWRSSRLSELCSFSLLALSGATPQIILRPDFAARRVCKVTAYRYGMVFQKVRATFQIYMYLLLVRHSPFQKAAAC